MWEVPDASVPLPTCARRPGIIIPYYRPDGQFLQVRDRPFGRVRWLNLQQPSGFHGKVKAARYGQPADTNVQVYFPKVRNIDWEAVLNDHTIPLMITEGEAKAAVACLMGFNCIALGGVYSTHNDGKLVKVLDDADWKSRATVMAFDSDAVTNPDVLAAEARLVEELGTQRQANIRIIRLPPDGEKKVGLDDFLNTYGPDALDKLIEDTPGMGALDAKVIALNKTIAWIDTEGAVYDFERDLVVQKSDFTNGNVYGSNKHIVRAQGTGASKVISVAETWLKHPHAARFTDLVFRPGDGPIVPSQHSGRAVNIWRGWNAEPGDVTPFLKLTEFLTSLEPQKDVRELPLKLLAWKAQHPKDKVQMCLVFTDAFGGGGKTIWAGAVAKAFAPYSEPISSAMFESDFNPFIERNVVAVVNEMSVEIMRTYAERIKTLITDESQTLNDKYRRIRKIISPTFYIICANNSGVASGFGRDDRRVLAFATPRPASDAFYDEFRDWDRSGGARHLMQYLLDYDLGDWQPPRRAPMTTTKRMAYREGMSPVQTLADDMRENDGNMHTLVQWLNVAEEWANSAEVGSDPKMAAQARAVKQGMQHIQVRPWYTAEELTLVFPVVLAQLYSTRSKETWTPGGLSRTLRDSGIPFLVNRDDPEGFMWHGRMRQYLVISQFNDWAQAITQADFERNMKRWPTYGEAMQQMRKAAK